MNPWHLLFSGKSIARLLLLLGVAATLSACYRLPFLPHREIDSFEPVASELTETMEIRGVTYVRVLNPDSSDKDQENPATIWVPLDVFRRGTYQPYQLQLAKKSPPPATAAAKTEPPGAGEKLSAASLPVAAPLPETKTLAEEKLVDTGEKEQPLPLRRRGIFFPSRATIRYPQITSQLMIELEQQLPLTMLAVGYIPPRSDSWQTNDTDTLIAQSRNWLKGVKNLPPAQLIFLLTEIPSSFYLRFQVSILDAQTANPVASFSIVINPAGGRAVNLVPPHPQPLVQLVLTSPWWCAVTPGHDHQTVFLAAGQKSRVTAGLHLQLRQPAVKIFDPKDGSLLGFAMGKPLAEAVVTDFFGQDGAIARLRSPLDIPPTGCLAVLIH